MIDAGVALNAAPCLAVDIGATKFECAIVAPDSSILSRSRVQVREHSSDLFGALIALISEVKADDAFEFVGVGCAGPMTSRGATVSPLNIPEWRNFELLGLMTDELGIRVHIDGDARALALAEGFFGGAVDDTSFASLVVSTGVGGALVLDGRLIDGQTGNAGHIGHLKVKEPGRLCSCGSYGCLEAEASGWAIEDFTGRPAKEADEATRRHCAELVGRALGTLSAVLDFSHSYVAGSVALGYGDEFFEVANKSARSVATLPYSSNVEIRRSSLGADGPILGAALVGWRGESS
jgi:glucokinase